MEFIDGELRKQRIEYIASLQETKLASGTAATKKYDWWIGRGKKEKTSRASATRIRKHRDNDVEKLEEKNENISMAQIKRSIGRLTVKGRHILLDKRNSEI